MAESIIDKEMKLIIQIALGIVLAVIIIKSLPTITGLVLIIVAGVIVYSIIYFIYDKLTGPARKRHYEESWKKLNEQR